MGPYKGFKWVFKHLYSIMMYVEASALSPLETCVCLLQSYSVKLFLLFFCFFYMW